MHSLIHVLTELRSILPRALFFFWFHKRRWAKRKHGRIHVVLAHSMCSMFLEVYLSRLQRSVVELELYGRSGVLWYVQYFGIGPFLMHSSAKVFFPVSIHYLQCIHCLLHYYIYFTSNLECKSCLYVLRHCVEAARRRYSLVKYIWK